MICYALFTSGSGLSEIDSSIDRAHLTYPGAYFVEVIPAPQSVTAFVDCKLRQC